MTIDKIFKIGILFLGVCMVAVLSFSIFSRHNYQFVKYSDAIAVFDQKSGRFYTSSDMKTAVTLDLVNGKRTVRSLASAASKQDTKDYYSKEVKKGRILPAGTTGNQSSVPSLEDQFSSLLASLPDAAPKTAGTTGNQSAKDYGNFSDLVKEASQNKPQ